jgi:hypothetical protein
MKITFQAVSRFLGSWEEVRWYMGSLKNERLQIQVHRA